MNNHVKILFCALVGAIAIRGPAVADCKPQTLLSSVDMASTENRDAFFVPVSINGTSKFMLLDTAGGISSLTSHTAEKMQLPTRHVRIEQINVSGQQSDLAAKTQTFDIGSLRANSMEFMIAPGNMLGDDDQVAGLLGPSILRNYDVSADFGSNKLDLISPDHCEGKVIYWPADVVAVVPIHISKDGGIHFNVTLDGVTVHAQLDTGAGNSTLTARTAESDFKLTSKSPDMVVLDHLEGHANAIIYQHKFATLDFEGLAVSNIAVDIMPDLIRNWLDDSADLGTHVKDTSIENQQPDMLLGMNVLKHLHIYIAYKEEKLYITPANPPLGTAKSN
ncbi:MAG: aspartyl protease family protein [Proteobacteria bacterium]|nr:aspartyl protease family protein [Pseudomonadota bacterium]